MSDTEAPSGASAEQRGRLDGVAVGLANFVIRFRWLIILAAVAGAIATGSGAQRLAYDNNYRAFFSEDNPELRNFEEFQATYTKSDNFVFLMVPNDGSEIFTNENLAAIAELTEAGWQIPFATRVDSVTNFQYTYANGDELIVEDLILEPGESLPETLAERKAAALAEPILNGQLLTPDGGVTAVTVTTVYPGEALDEIPIAVAEARALRDRIEEAYPQFDIYISGTSMLNNAFSEAIAADFQSLIPLMIAVIVIVTIIAVRSVSATLTTVALVVLATMFGMGWAGFVGIKLAGPSPSAVIVILTLAIADSVHILISARTAMRAGLDQRAAIVEAIRINFLAVSVTSITTIVGFMALNFSDAPPFRDFGNISAVGIAAAWILSLTFLPAVLSIVRFRATASETRGLQERALAGLGDVVVARARTLMIALGLGVVALVAFIPRIELTDQFREYFSEKIEFRRDSDELIKHFGFYTIEFSAKAPGPGAVSDPEFLKNLEAFSEWLRDQEGVTHVFTLSDIMKRLNKNLNQDDPDFYRLPEDRDLAAQYLFLYELSLPYGLDLNDRIDIDKSQTRVTAQFDGQYSTKKIRELLAKTEAWFDANAPEMSAPATGPQVMFTFIAQRNVESMVTGTLAAIAMIAVIMMIALRSVALGLLSVVPNGLPILAAFGVWAILVGEVGFSVAAVASLSLGIVIDDTVHFLVKYVRARRERGLAAGPSIKYAFETVGAAIVTNTVVLLAGFLVISMSSFKINQEMGLLTSLTIGLALILDFFLLPGLLLLGAKRQDDRAAALQPQAASA
ncbi:MAG: RND family transporter [Parvularculaceae bacterium]